MAPKNGWISKFEISFSRYPLFSGAFAVSFRDVNPWHLGENRVSGLESEVLCVLGTGVFGGKKMPPEQHGKALKQAEMAELQKEVQVVFFLEFYCGLM